MIDVGPILVALAILGAPLDTRERYAADIATAAPDIETGIALVVTGWEETHFRARLERCLCEPSECDGGAAFGLYQLHAHWLMGHSSSDVCTDNGLSTALAARTLGILRRRAGTVEGAFARYVGAPPTDRRIVRRARLYQQLLRGLASAGEG